MIKCNEKGQTNGTENTKPLIEGKIKEQTNEKTEKLDDCSKMCSKELTKRLKQNSKRTQPPETLITDANEAKEQKKPKRNHNTELITESKDVKKLEKESGDIELDRNHEIDKKVNNTKIRDRIEPNNDYERPQTAIKDAFRKEGER